jgi:hypothetical protein
MLFNGARVHMRVRGLKNNGGALVSSFFCSVLRGKNGGGGATVRGGAVLFSLSLS